VAATDTISNCSIGLRPRCWSTLARHRSRLVRQRWHDSRHLLAPGQSAEGAVGPRRSRRGAKYFTTNDHHESECDKVCWMSNSSVWQQNLAILVANWLRHKSLKCIAFLHCTTLQRNYMPTINVSPTFDFREGAHFIADVKTFFLFY